MPLAYPIDSSVKCAQHTYLILSPLQPYFIAPSCLTWIIPSLSSYIMHQQKNIVKIWVMSYLSFSKYAKDCPFPWWKFSPCLTKPYLIWITHLPGLLSLPTDSVPFTMVTCFTSDIPNMFQMQKGKHRR